MNQVNHARLNDKFLNPIGLLLDDGARYLSFSILAKGSDVPSIKSSGINNQNIFV